MVSDAIAVVADVDVVTVMQEAVDQRLTITSSRKMSLVDTQIRPPVDTCLPTATAWALRVRASSCVCVHDSVAEYDNNQELDHTQ